MLVRILIVEIIIKFKINNNEFNFCVCFVFFLKIFSVAEIIIKYKTVLITMA